MSLSSRISNLEQHAETDPGANVVMLVSHGTARQLTRTQWTAWRADHADADVISVLEHATDAAAALRDARAAGLEVLP